MLKKFSTRELVLIVLLTVLSVVFGFIFGVLNTITGIPLLAAINGLIAVILASFLFMQIRKFGALLIFFILHGILIIPSPALGPPGFYKPIVMIIIGLVIETILLIGKKKIRLAIPIAMAIGLALVPPLTYILGKTMGIPNIEKTLPIIHIMIIAAIIFGLFGGWLGIKLYDKLKNKKVFRI